MSRLRFGLCLVSVIALPLGLGGCVGAVVVGGLAAAAGGGYAAGQERGVTGAVDDFSIKNDIEKGLMQADSRFEGVTTTVYEGRVLLSGHVPTPEMKMTADQVAGHMHDVRALYDEIEVTPGEGMWNDAKDAWITARVRSELVLDPEIRSINYSIDTANGSVYLIGSARSQNELEHVTRAARYVPGVRRVVSYVDIRGGGAVASAPSAAPPPVSYGAPAPGYAPSPSSPGSRIEVQKL